MSAKEISIILTGSEDSCIITKFEENGEFHGFSQMKNDYAGFLQISSFFAKNGNSLYEIKSLVPVAFLLSTKCSLSYLQSCLVLMKATYGVLDKKDICVLFGEVKCIREKK